MKEIAANRLGRTFLKTGSPYFVPMYFQDEVTGFSIVFLNTEGKLFEFNRFCNPVDFF